MSRSRPHENGTPNPATRWFEWQGEHGTVRYYDKDAKQNIDVPLPFTFILLDELGSVRGWHDASQSAIYSNEVKDTRADVLIVKAFKGGTLAEGMYRDIKDRVNTLGGAFNANCYVAFKGAGDELAMGSLRFKGAALGAWMEFRKAHRSELYTKAVTITGFTEGKKGRIIFRVPTFATVAISAETSTAAVALDEQLQAFLDGYLARNKQDQAEAISQAQPEQPDVEHAGPITVEDIPFAWLLPFLLPAALLAHLVVA